MKKTLKLIIVLVLVLALGAAGVFIYLPREAPDAAVEEYISTLISPSEDSPLNQLIDDSVNVTIGEQQLKGRQGTQTVTLTYAHIDLINDKMSQLLPEKLSAKVAQAKRAAEVYDESYAFLPAVLDAAYEEVFSEISENISSFTVSKDITLDLSYDGAWQVNLRNEPGAEPVVGYTTEEKVTAMLKQVVADTDYIPISYSLPFDALQGPVPSPDGFHQSEDPAELLALLQTPAAQKLINGQELCWNENIELIPGTPIRWYFDESILVIVWQERTCDAVGTYQEVFIADGSQFRRKLAGDSFWGDTYLVPTELARQSNAVAAMAGDRCAHGERPFGIFTTMGDTPLIHTSFGEVCYITADGDMLFSYPEQFATDQEVLDFIRDNNVSFSLSWGPVLIDNGVDVTPNEYLIGEINDHYARACLGMLGERHYLGLTINCGTGSYYNLVTLRQAADVMVERGCYKAYTLDGGQTASIIINNELINPVQFGWERTTSDIIYFATALE